LRPFAKPAYIDLVNAFIFSGLLKLKTRMLPSCLLKISLIDPSYGVTQAKNRNILPRTRKGGQGNG